MNTLLNKELGEDMGMQELAPDQVPEGWSNIAEVYENSFESMTSQLAEKALELLDIQLGESVLDVATGPGVFALGAARRGASVLATDFAPGMIERLQKRIDNFDLSLIKAQVMDGQNLECEDGCFDVSASIVGVIFFPDIAKGVAELKRVLKPGGRSAIVCWGDPANFQMFQYLQKAIAQAVPDFEMPTDTPVWARMSGNESLQSHMQQAGFNNVEVTSFIGRHEIESPADYWNSFTSSAPPLKMLFTRLGEANTARVGEAFVELIMQDTDGGTPCLAAEACVGVGIA